MLLCVDVQYEDSAAVTACVGFARWSDVEPALELVMRAESVPEPYEPGQFYKRELPHLVRVLERGRREESLEAIVIDGHVWLTAGEPGLGAHLYEALRGEIAIVGVAKNEFHDGVAVPVLRGQSAKPLFVTAVGMDASVAAQHVLHMHGPHRIPTLLKRVDQLARGHALPRVAEP